MDGSIKKLKVLIVDDEDMVRRALGRLFRRHEVFLANGFTQAMLILETESLDVIISDCHMPEKSGVEVLLAAHSLQPSTIRWMVSGNPPRDIDRMLEDGVIHRFLRKPWDIDAFHEFLS